MRIRRRIVAILLVISLAVNLVFVIRYAFGTWPWVPIINYLARTDRPYSDKDDTPFAYRMYGTTLETVLPSASGGGKDLPDALVIPPGCYRVWGRQYDLTQEGLYRFVAPGKRNRQRIVYNEDPDVLLSGIAWIASHGTADDALTNKEKIAKAMRGKLSLTCGEISVLAQALLENAGVKSRLVMTLTLDEWNTYDNAHTFIEVFRDEWGKHVAYDLDNNGYFIHAKKKVPLSVMEFIRCLPGKEYVTHRIAADTPLDVSGFRSSDGFDWTFLAERIQANLHDWYARVAQVALVKDGARFCFCDEANKERILSYNFRFRYMDRESFYKKFYPSENPINSRKR